MTVGQHSRDTAVRTLVLGLLLVLALGCTKEPKAEDELETVDVRSGTEVDTGSDVKAVKEGPTLTGVLPSHFPKDLPLYLPASLVDYGDTAKGRKTVSLLTPDPLSDVRRALLARLRDAGWNPSAGAGEAEVVVLQKGGRPAWLYLGKASTGTLYRYEYLR